MKAAAVLLLPLFLAASPAPPVGLEELGRIHLPPGSADVIHNVASAAGIEIVAIEPWSGEFLAGVFAYGPPARSANGLCRGAVYLLDTEKAPTRPEQWAIRPLDQSALRARYVLSGSECGGSLSSRVLIVGAIEDAEVGSILKAIQKRTIARDDSPFPRHSTVDRRWSISAVHAEEDHERVTVLMVDHAREDETMTVLVAKTAAGWGIVDSGDVAW